MRAEHLKGWLVEARKEEREEATADHDTTTEGTTEGPDGMGREETKDIREKTPAEDSNWERVVDLVQTAFGEGRLAE